MGVKQQYFIEQELCEGLIWTWRTDDWTDEKGWGTRLGVEKRNRDLWDGMSVKSKKKGQGLSYRWKRMCWTGGGRLVNWAFYVRRRNRESIARGCGTPVFTKARGCPFGVEEGLGQETSGLYYGNSRAILWSSSAVHLVYKPTEPLSFKSNARSFAEILSNCNALWQNNDNNTLGRNLRFQP